MPEYAITSNGINGATRADGSRKYADFVLLLEKDGDQYKARVLESSRGFGMATFRPSFSEAELAALVQGPLDENAQALGQSLYNLVFQGEVAELWQQSLGARQDGQGLRLRLRFGRDAGALLRYPWEYLYRSLQGDFLALSLDTLLVRDLEQPGRPTTLTVKLPLKILAVICAPRDYPPIDAAEEWNFLQDALRELTRQGLVTIERLEKPTLDALRARLRRRDDCHVLHFVGHGGFMEGDGAGGLVFEAEDRSGNIVTGQQVARELETVRALRLAVMIACKSGRTAPAVPFGGVAQRLMQQELPAVVAMQFNISVAAARTFARAFYGALAGNEPVDCAVVQGRRAIYDSANSAEWAIPVLYLRTPDGKLFDVEPLSEDGLRANQVAAYLFEAREARAAENWPGEIESLGRALSLDPGHARAGRLMDVARLKEGIPALYDRGLQQYAAGHWREALDYFLQVQAVMGNYRDVFALLAGANAGIAGVERSESADPWQDHIRDVVEKLKAGQLVPFLGQDVNGCGRQPLPGWQAGELPPFAPTGRELASYLAERAGYPKGEKPELGRVAQYYHIREPGEFLQEMDRICRHAYPPLPVHQFLARLPARLRALNCPKPCPLIVTTNYDQALEHAFERAYEPFDLIAYAQPDPEDAGRFWYVPHDARPAPIDNRETFRLASLGQRTVIVKLHAPPDLTDLSPDSFIVTEDDYINNLTWAGAGGWLPNTLIGAFKTSSLLFLGYALQDWNQRILPGRIVRETPEKTRMQRWAIGPLPGPVEQAFLELFRVKPVCLPLDAYVAALDAQLAGVRQGGGGS